ncbi:hypothetical protein [Paractinoplanes maris]|uniref:hypothetical protein n=1 Tax=Paractinoplanes maris TaxID=1734446 RepID=UPI0020212AF6|nr:hypothetical protein [Actinoplanes maris]
MSLIHRLLGAAVAVLTTAALGTPAARAAEPDVVDLVAGPRSITYQSAPGGVVWPRIEITNLGPRAVTGVVLRLITDPGDVNWFSNYRNCVYREGRHEAICKFGTTLEPGQTYEVESAHLKVLPTTTPDRYHFLHMWWTKDDFDSRGPSYYSQDKMTGGVAGLMFLRPVATAPALTTDPTFGNNIGYGQIAVS